MRWFLGAMCALLLSACNPVANLDAGEQSIEAYQAAYSANDADALWNQVGQDFRDVTTREQFDDLLEVLQSRLGAIESSERAGFNVNTTTDGTFTVVQMSTQFEQGEGVETYTFLGNGEDMELVGWNVNSDRLLLTADDLEAMAEEGEE